MAKRRLLFTKQSMSRAFKRSTQKMKRRAKKRKASVISDPANTSSGTTSLRMLIENDKGPYMKNALGLYQYINTCVPDTLFASFHILSIKFLRIQSFLMSDHFFRELINTLNEEKYNYARALWIKQLPDFHKLDRFSNIKDHFSIVHKLVCAKIDYHQETPQNHPIYRTTLSKFRPFGDPRALGDIAETSLILVHQEVFNPRYNLCAPRIPPLVVTDDNKRIFQLQFMLLGKEDQMTMCYDTDQAKPFHHFSIDGSILILKNMDIYLAGYVNMTQAQEYKHGAVTSLRCNNGKKMWIFLVPNLKMEQFYERIFQLQFMLLGKEDQMTMCYDTDQAKPFHHFSIDGSILILKNMDIYLAGYVNMTQAQEYKHGAVTSLRCNNGKKMWIFLVPNLKMEQFYERLRQQIDYLSIYIKDDGCADPNQFINTCVLDSFLAALHIAYIGYPNIADLLNGNDFFRHIIFLLQQKRFYEARRSCVDELGLGKVDLFGPVKEYFPLIRKLVWPENPPNDSEITKKLKEFGSVIVLGDPSDPSLILVHCEVHHGLSMELPRYVNDDEKKRIFARIFLLIGKDEHMTMCFPVAEESWLQYDNDPKKTSFQPLDVNNLKDYIICLAGYVNVTQALEYKLGVAETGKEARLSNVHDEPFQQFYPQQSVLDVDMEDLSFTNPISIPETGVGTRPFDQNQQDILPEINNQEMAVEDVEMLSCNSCDSD